MRSPQSLTIQDGDREISVRITPLDSYRGAMFGVRVACLLGVPALSSLRHMSDEEVVGKLAQASVDAEGIKALLDELLGCCERVTDSGSFVRITAQTAAGQIEDPSTIVLLWVASFRVSFGFFAHGGLSNVRDRLSGVLKQIGS